MKKILPALLFLCLLTVVMSVAAEVLPVQGSVAYGQTEARSMLDMINSFRTGSDAWYWNETNTEKIICSDLESLELDSNLEKAAMQRAAEIAFCFSHTRPEGSSCFTVMNEYSVNAWSFGENIAAGYSTAASVFTGWKETYEDYSGQGHRRNMISAKFNRVGIGHAEADGYHFWVQEFARIDGGASPVSSDAVDGLATVSVRIREEVITILTDVKPVATSVSLDYGETASPGLSAALFTNEIWPSNRSMTITVFPAWTSADPLCVATDQNRITGHALGSTTVRAVLGGKTTLLPVTVRYSGRLTPDLVLPKKLVNLEAEAFYKAAMKAVLLPAGLQQIGANAFSACSGLKQVTITSDTTEIDDSAFAGRENSILIFCHEGSTAHSFALTHGISVVFIR